MQTTQFVLAASARPVASKPFSTGTGPLIRAIAAVMLPCVLLSFTACDDGDEHGSDACEALAAEFDTALAATFAATSRKGGTAAAVITPQCGLWEGTVGNATDDSKLTPEHLLRVGSTTKTFVAATILSLVADGALELDDTIEAWAPYIPNAEKITIRQLLNHTSGIYNYTNDTSFMTAAFRNPTVSYTPQELVDVSQAHAPLFEPGAAWEYSNTNYILLGMIIESVTGNPVAVEMRNRIIEPQSLTHTCMMDYEEMSGVLADGYGPAGEDSTFALHSSAAWTAGVMASTAGDLAHWAQTLYTGGISPPSELDTMLEFVDTEVAPFDYGLGAMIFDASYAGAEIIGHGGSIPGFRTEMYYLPQFDSTVVTVVNSDADYSIDAMVALIEQIKNR